MPIGKFLMTDEPEADVSSFTATQRLAMVWETTLDAWASTGREIPSYARSDAPGKMIRGRHGAT